MSDGVLTNIPKHEMCTVIIPLTHRRDANYLRIHASSADKPHERHDQIHTATGVKIRGEMVPLYKVAHHNCDWLPNCMITLHLPLNIPYRRQGSHNPRVPAHRVWLGSDSLPYPPEARPSETICIPEAERDPWRYACPIPSFLFQTSLGHLAEHT
jgi:hypothetical protein